MDLYNARSEDIGCPKNDVEGFFNKLQENILYIGDNTSTKFYAYRIYSIIWRKYIDLLRPEHGKGFDIEDLGTLLRDVNKLRATFRKKLFIKLYKISDIMKKLSEIVGPPRKMCW